MKRYRMSVALYRRLLHLYPRRFQRRFAESMAADLEEMLRGSGSRLRCWKQVLVDLAWSVPREHLRERAIEARPRRTPWNGLSQELRQVARGLGKSPLFTVVSTTTLALGVGATTAIFSLVHATLLTPLSFGAPERLVALWEHQIGSETRTNDISPANYRDWKRRGGAFEAMAAYNFGYDILTDEARAPERVGVGLVEPDFFSVLGVSPMLGRDFERDESIPGNDDVVLLSAEYWRQRFGGDPTILGTSITIDRERCRIVGVMPEGLDFPGGAAMWRPLALDESRWTSQRGSHFLSAVARLRPGVTVDEARAEMDAVSSQLAAEYPDSNEGWDARVFPLKEDLVFDIRPSLLLLQVSVLLVLLIAGVNVAGLQLGRAGRRAGEMALRSALGAGSARLTRLVLVESALISATGGALGLVVAFGTLVLLRPLAPVPIPEIEELLVAGRVLGFAIAMAVACGLIFGVVPALATTRDVGTRLIRGIGHGTPRQSRSRELLVASEVAVSLVLLVGAGLLLESFYRLVHVDAGVDRDEVLSFRVSIPSAEYDEPVERRQFFESLHRGLSEIPGVESAALTTDLPVTGSPGRWQNGFYRPDHPPTTPADKVSAYLRWVSPGYLKTIGIPLVRGRDVETSDTIETRPVVLIDEAMAETFFPGEDPLGKRIVVEYNDWECEIVGIVGNTRQTSLWDRHDPHMYLPYRQTYEAMYVGSMVAVLRARGEPSELAAPAMDLVRSLDPLVAPVEVQTLATRFAESVRYERFQLALVSTFAGFALALALVGLYGVIAHAVSQRRREVGVRMALGADARDILVLLLRQGVTLVGSGMVVGLVASLALGTLVAPFLFDVSARDAGILGSASAVLLAAAVCAIWLPARSASSLDPVTVLRCE